MRGPNPIPLCLEDNLQHELETLVRRHTTPQQIVLRARIVLLAHQGDNNPPIARQVGIGLDMAAIGDGGG